MLPSMKHLIVGWLDGLVWLCNYVCQILACRTHCNAYHCVELLSACTAVSIFVYWYFTCIGLTNSAKQEYGAAEGVSRKFISLLLFGV